MAQITVKNASGKDAGSVDLDDATFAIQPNVPVMHQVVTAQLAARRAGTHSTKTRSTVRGGGRKPYRQKGTGNARQGSTRGPHYSGGAVAHGPLPRKYNQKTPKKMISLALRSALSDRANEGKVIVVDSWGFDKPSTKAATKALDVLGVEGRVLVVVGRDDVNSALSFRNIPEVQLITPAELNAYDVLCNDVVVFTQDVLPVFGGSSKTRNSAAAPAQSFAAVAEAPGDETDDADETVDADETADDAVEADDADDAVEADDDADDAVEAAGDVVEFAAGEWDGSVTADADGNGPESHLIKGNADSMLYHTPGSRFYKQTKAEVWFDTEESAEAAGFSKPASQLAAEADQESAES
jgi:large subunit ribosomal protein L4